MKVIKHCIDVIAPTFAKLLDFFVKKNDIPSELKCAIVTPLFKNKGDANCPDNYRGISVLSLLQKFLKDYCLTRF